MIIWNKEKNEWLKEYRGVCFEDVEKIIETNSFLDFLDNPRRKNQYVYIIHLNDYTYLVPCIINEEGTIFLKTMYPDRKYHKIYKHN